MSAKTKNITSTKIPRKYISKSFRRPHPDVTVLLQLANSRVLPKQINYHTLLGLHCRKINNEVLGLNDVLQEDVEVRSEPRSDVPPRVKLKQRSHRRRK